MIAVEQLVVQPVLLLLPLALMMNELCMEVYNNS